MSEGFQEFDDPGLMGQPPLAPGYLACLPLFLAYELAFLVGVPTVSRNGAESLLFLALAPLGDGGLLAASRSVILLAGAGWALRWYVLADGDRLGRRVARTIAEGAVAALVLGPVLLLLLGFFHLRSMHWGLAQGAHGGAPGLAGALRLVGGAPYEELLFRVLVYGCVFLLAVRTAEFLGAARGIATAFGDVAALLGSSLAFAAFHLDAVQGLLGREGDPFQGGVFLWRLLAGLLLAWLFRWRGLGTAAWTHAFFNLALALGAGPGVRLAG